MRVLVTPDRVEVGDGNAVEINVTVHNTGMLIGGYHLRVLGADPSWVTLGAENLSLFPDASETVRAVVRLPPGVAAGERRMAVQVRELTPPQAISIADIVLTVPAVESLRVALSPMTVVGGRSGTFGVVLENTGNTPVVAQLAGTDAEDVMRFAFEPDVVTLAPGDQAITDLRATGPRRWFGQPVVRTFGIGLRPLLPPAPPEHSGPPASEEPLATGTLLQKARLSRGLLSLLSLLFAATVFATVLTIALTALVGQSAADRDLAIQVAAAQNTDGLAGTSALGGSVVLLTSGDPVPGVSVELFDAAATTTPIANAATGDDGTWTIDNLPAGAYKFRVRGAGFAEIWYENALTAAEAKEVVLNLGQQIRDLKVTLGGLPASVSGEVVGSDVAGAVLSVQVPVEFLPADPAAVADNEAAASDLTPAGAVLRTVPIGSDGLFEITDIASPAVYDLVVTKTGFATATERVDLTGGESRSGVQIRLRTGDGLISGSVTGPDGVLGGAVITATTGTTTAETVSLTEGDIGGFTLRGLVTPATYSVTVTSPGFSPQTTSVSLADGQTLTGVQLAVARSAGSLNGIVSTVPGNEPAAGVTVSVTAGTDTVETV
ncbi:carboxypeptidase regulatory-like domain-containing protein, partial [Nakamurella sp. GG22]